MNTDGGCSVVIRSKSLSTSVAHSEGNIATASCAELELFPVCHCWMHRLDMTLEQYGTPTPATFSLNCS